LRLEYFDGQAIRDLARAGTTQIDKLDFLDFNPASHLSMYKNPVIVNCFVGSGVISLFIKESATKA